MKQAAEQTPSVWNAANAMTGLRLVLVPVFAWLLLEEHGEDTTLRLAAFGVFVAAALTDKADGELARRRGLVTDFGKVADPIADKALVGTALVGLCVLGELAWWVAVVILVRELGITLLRFWVIRYGVIAASRGGKAKTLLQTVAIAMYILPLGGVLHLVAMVVMGAAVVLTVVTGADYVVRAIRLRTRGAGG